MTSFEVLISELLDESTPKRKYERVLELIEAEKELSRAKGLIEAWEIFRRGISDRPELLKWCPENTVTIHDPELPGVTIIEQIDQ